MKHRLQALVAASGLAIAIVPTGHAQDPVTLPQITVTAPPSGGSGTGNQGIGTGTGTGTGNAKAFEKLNRELKRKVDEVNPVINALPLDARSPDTKVGVINIPAVQQQYGRNFGQSAFPYRPPPPVYAPPLGHH